MDLLDEADAIATWGLIQAGLDGVAAPSPATIARGLGCRMAHHILWGTDGFSDVRERTLNVRACHDAREQNDILAHELFHQIAYDMGSPYWQEDALADEGKNCLQLPSRSARDLVKQLGMRPDLWIAAYPDMPPHVVLIRAAQESELLAVVRVGLRRLVGACRYREVHSHIPGERALVRTALRTGAPIFPWAGTSVWPFVDLGELRSVVLLVDLHATSMADSF